VAFNDEPGMLLRGAYLTFRRALQAHCAPFGITSDQLVLLTVLAEEEGISQTELAARSYTDPSTLTAMLRLIERQGWIERRTNGDDDRVHAVYLTRKGRKLQQKVFASHLPIIDRLAHAGSTRDLAAARRWLRQVIDRFQRTEDRSDGRTKKQTRKKG